MAITPSHSSLYGTILFSFLLPALQAQQLPIRPYSTADGLPNYTVNAIIKDSHEFLWFCTGGGLARFDGYQFTNYGEAEGLPSAWVDVMLETRGGEYWVGTAGGLCHFNPSKASERFTVYRPDGGSSRRVLALVEDHAGHLWVGTGRGLYRFQAPIAAGQSKQEKELGGSTWQPVVLMARGADPEIHGLAEDRNGSLWIGTSSGLYRRYPDGRTDRWRIGPPGVNVTCLVLDRYGTLWAGTWEDGLWKIPLSGTASAERVLGTQGAVVWSLREGDDGHLWADIQSPFSANGLCDVEDGAGIAHCYGNRNGIKWKVTAQCEDRQGNLWFGTEGFGAFREARPGFDTFPVSDSTDILETKTGELCAGRRRDVAVFQAGRFTEVGPRFPVPLTQLGWSGRQTILQDRDGDWWFPTGQGLYRFGPAARARSLAGSVPKAVYTHRDGLATDNVFRLFEDRAGNIWVASVGPNDGSGNGLSCWQRSTEKWHHYFSDPGAPQALRDLASSIGQDRAGAIWIGFWHGQLARFRGGAFQFFGASDGWIGDEVRAIHEDRLGTLWICSRGGLTYVRSAGSEHPKFQKFSDAERVSINDVLGVSSDDTGRLYVATGHGVDQIDVERTNDSIRVGRIRHYTTADGLAPGELQAVYRDRAGAIWFASKVALSRLQPETAPSHPAPALIRTLHIAGVPMPVSELGENAVLVPRLKPGQDNIRIEYSGLDFAPGETLRYQYMLEGADRGWSEPTLQRSVNYANLSPGGYRFLVRIADAELAGRVPVSSVVFTIDPPLWRRWWFLASLAVAMIGAGTALYRLRVGQLLELERVRTRIATDLHDDIGSNLSQIAILSEVALQQDATSPNGEALARIADVSRETVHSMSDIVWAVDPEHDRFSDLANRMRRFANDVLGACNIELRFHSVGEHDIHVSADVRREIFLIFKECVNNAARHSGCDAADIELAVEHRELRLKVADNGRGLDPAAAHSGHGLNSIRRRTEALGGEIQISSPGAVGVSVHLRVPLSDKVLHV